MANQVVLRSGQAVRPSDRGSGAACALVLVVAPFMAMFVLMLFSGGALRPAAMAVLFPFILSLMPTLFASFYASYRDIFAREDSLQPT